jgi:hypothetical protein
MPGAISLTIEVYETGNDTLTDLQMRAKDMTVVFQNIIRDWAKDNTDKFDAAAGDAKTGAEIDPTVYWEQLTPDYLKSKKKVSSAGPDDIMVLTGKLRDSLTSLDGFMHSVSPQSMDFGEPTDQLDADKVAYNWARRQTIFLSVDDQRMIDAHVSNYFNFGGDYEAILFAKGVQAVQKRKAQAEIEFNFPDEAA